MATTPKGPSKSAFLRDLFQRNPGVTEREANAAWKEAGYEGAISTSTFYNLKTAYNKQSAGGADPGEATAVKPRPKSPAKGTQAKRTTKSAERPEAEANGRDATPEPEVRSESAPNEDQGRLLDEMEDRIDDLIFRLKSIGARPEVVEALRRARRLLYRSPH